MFQLTDEEWKNQRSQIVTFDKDTRKYKQFVPDTAVTKANYT